MPYSSDLCFSDAQGSKPRTGGPTLTEDYAEIVDEEGDYSTPASKFYEKKS